VIYHNISLIDLNEGKKKKMYAIKVAPNDTTMSYMNGPVKKGERGKEKRG